MKNCLGGHMNEYEEELLDCNDYEDDYIDDATEL